MANNTGLSKNMEEADVIRLISQYLSDHNFHLTLQSLEKERSVWLPNHQHDQVQMLRYKIISSWLIWIILLSGRQYKPIMDKKNGELQEILGMYECVTLYIHALQRSFYICLLVV